MKFLPYERLKIHTALSREAVLQRLESVIEPKRSLRLFKPRSKPYEGKLEGPHFEISRIIGYRNSFLPMIKGDVQTELGGCSIHITMHLHILVIVFMLFWCGFVGANFLGALSTLVLPQAQAEPTDPTFLFISVGMLVFAYTLCQAGFKLESIKAKNFFRDLFEAREVEEMGIANLFNMADKVS